MYEVMFLICISIYILWKFFQYTLHWDKIQQMLKKLSSDEKNIQQMRSFFFRDLQLIPVLFLIRNFYTSWNTWFISLKLHLGFSILHSVSFLLNFILLFNKNHALFPLKIKMLQKPHTVLILFLSWNKKFENLMIPAWVGASQKLTWRQTF